MSSLDSVCRSALPLPQPATPETGRAECASADRFAASAEYVHGGGSFIAHPNGDRAQSPHLVPTRGALLGVVALMTGQWLLLPVIAIIPLAETLSVALQVLYFKWTGGLLERFCLVLHSVLAEPENHN